MKYALLIIISLMTSANLFSQEAKDNPLQEASALLSGKPVLFLENKGQIMDVKGNQVPSVLFKTAVSGIETYITTKGLVYVFSKSDQKKSRRKITEKDHFKPEMPEASPVEREWLQVHLEGADIRPENVVKEFSGKTDYRFFQKHCPDGITGVKEYGKITVKNVYPGIDWVLYGSSAKGMKYDFIVHPGADPSQIKLRYEGEHPVTIDKKGNIQVNMRWATITENAPVSFAGDEHSEVKSAFKSEAIDQYNVRVTYVIGDYSKDQVLIIDPELTWGTRFGGSGYWERLSGITHDSNDNIFITGTTNSADFPLLDAGTYFEVIPPLGPFYNAIPFILKFDNDGVLLWSTAYGNMGSASPGISITCDPNDNIFLAGITTDTTFPLLNSGTYFQSINANGNVDGFILKFDNAGNRLWATGYGGSNDDALGSLSCDAAGNLFVAGSTGSSDFPLQNSGTYFQPFAGVLDAVILKFDNAGNRLWATCYGGSDVEGIASIACDAAGNVFITGATWSPDFPVQDAGTYFDGVIGSPTDFSDVFIVKFDNAGNRLWGTFYGGFEYDLGYDLETDENGNLFVTGYTSADDFPVQDAGTYFDPIRNGSDVFILKFDNAGNRLWATFYGGTDAEEGIRLSLDKCGNLYVTMVTDSDDMQTIDLGGENYFDSIFDGGNAIGIGWPPSDGYDAFLARFTNDGVHSWATYIGSTETEYATICEVDEHNNLFLVGEWEGYTGDLLVDPGNGAYFDATLDPTDINDGFIFKFTFVNELHYTTAQTSAGCNCSGTATVNITNAPPPYTYTWSNGYQVSNSTSPTSTATNLCPGNYWVEISTSVCNIPLVDTVFFTIAGETVPVVNFSAADTTVCIGTCIDFSANTVAGASYSWSLGDGNTSTNASLTHCYAAPGNYTVALTIDKGQGCSSTQTMSNYIDVYPVPVAGIAASPESATISAPVVEFTEQASGEISWRWNFGDGQGQSDEPNPSYTYNQAGTFPVSLIVSNEYGCEDTAFIYMNIFNDLTFYVPNAFTPDGDEVNNTWLPNGIGIDTYKMELYNRWGELIWETANLQKGWDGTVNGKHAPDGVYTWKATIVFERNRSTKTYTGSVTLIR